MTLYHKGWRATMPHGMIRTGSIPLNRTGAGAVY
jgi:hypothetical protein